jgi:hypothetical protein
VTPTKQEPKVPARLTQLAELLSKTAVEVKRQGAVAHRLLADWENAEGYGHGRSYEGGSRTSAVWCDRHQDDRCDCTDKVPIPEVSDPVGSEIARGVSDPVEAAKQRVALEHLERQIATNLVDVLHLYRKIAGYATGDVPPPDAVQRPSRGGDCEACYRYVPGTESDRLRAGLCNTDRVQFERDRARASREGKRLERQEWLIGRRKELAARAVEEPERIDPTASPIAHVEVTHMATGEKLTLTPEQVAVWRTLNVEQRREFAAALRGA